MSADGSGIESTPRLYVPWLDCSGPGFDKLWDQVHSTLRSAISSIVGGVGRGLAALPASAIPQLLPWDEIAKVLPGPEDFDHFTVVHHRVLEGDDHPNELAGHCHLGVVLLKYLVGRARASVDPRAAVDNLTNAWELLVYPLGAFATFDFLESSRWGAFLSTDMLLEAVSAAQGSPSVGVGPSLSESVGGLLPGMRSPRPKQSVRGPRPTLSCRPSAQTLLRGRRLAWNRNLTVVAISTHVAILEPAASLRAQLLQEGVRPIVHFLGVLHPSGTMPCELLPRDTRCGRLHGWGDDVQRSLFDLGDMRSNDFRSPGFTLRLSQTVEVIHRRHIARRADMVVCAHPFLLCALLRAFTKLFMLIYLTPTPLTLVPEGDRLWVLVQLASLAGSHSSTAVLAASPVYALHALYQAGVRVRPVRPCSLYIAERYRWHSDGEHRHQIFMWIASGLSQQFLVTAQGFVNEGRREGVPWLQDVELRVKELLQTPLVTWDYLAGVRCVVLLPWDLQLTAFPELYALGVPLVLPTAEYVASYGLRILEKRQVAFWAVHPGFAGKLPGIPSPDFAAEPWVRVPSGHDAAEMLRAKAQFLYWFRASDFETFGHTLRFSSLPEMLQHAAGIPASELAVVSMKMRTEWAKAQRSTASAYNAVVKRLLAGLGSPSGRK